MDRRKSEGGEVKLTSDCNHCKGKGFVKVENKITDFELCKICDGMGTVTRPIVAEDLSVEEQRRVASAWHKWTYEENKPEFKSVLDWQGLKK